MEKSAKTIKGKDLRASFLADLNSLSNAGSKDCFDKVVILFKKKWGPIESARVPLNHLVKEWLNQRLTRFYRGSAEGYAMNNNGLEGTNKIIKDAGTFHELMPLLEFLPTMSGWIGKQSYRRNPENINCIPIAYVPSVLNTKEMTDGHILYRSKKNFRKVEDHFISITRKTKKNVQLTLLEAENIFKTYCESSYKSMDSYNSFQKYVHVITPDRRCNCYEFGRKFKCPHATCVRILIDKIQVPQIAKSVPLSCNRKPGRPPMALGRYDVQDFAQDGVVEKRAVQRKAKDCHGMRIDSVESPTKKRRHSSSSVLEQNDDNSDDDNDYPDYEDADDSCPSDYDPFENNLTTNISSSASASLSSKERTTRDTDSSSRGYTALEAGGGRTDHTTRDTDGSSRGYTALEAGGGRSKRTKRSTD